MGPEHISGATSPSRGRVTCPVCATVTEALMPLDACLYFFECPGCRRVLKPKAGDCCVFCSYGDRPCPPKGGSPPATLG